MIDESPSVPAKGPPARPDLSVLIVTYNSLPFVLDCLRAVEGGTTTLRVEVLVADNASTDGSVHAVRTAAPQARVIEMGGNAGFARANNRLLAAASGRHALLLNGDAFPDPGALEEMVAFADSHRDAGVVAPALLNADRTDQRTARSFPSPAAAIWGRRSPLTRAFPDNRWSRRYLVERPEDRAEAYEVDWVSGACLMAPVELLRDLGGLDEGFFMHFEDADLCKRIKDTGRQVWCVPSATVVHLEGASRRGWPAAQVRYFHHGAYRFYARNYLTGPKAALRPLAAGLLAVRAAGVVGVNLATGRRRDRGAAPADVDLTAVRGERAGVIDLTATGSRLGPGDPAQYAPVPAGTSPMEASDS
ncbi:MAG: glycosyltransferase family 2 protein [Acidimicrobiia bacterium]